MKKSAVIVIFLAGLLLISLGFASGAENATGADKAYECLKNQIASKQTLNLQESTFATIALGDYNKTTATLESEKGTNCWPKSGCKVKDTAQAALAYDRMGKNTDDIMKWIASMNVTSSDLTWFLEIDATNHAAATCTIRSGSETGTVSIGDDMKLSGSAGSCLSISDSGYWLRISGTTNCLEREYEISCNQDFISTKLYQKGTEGTVYVSSETNSAPGGGTTKEKIISRCLKAGPGGTGCDYESTLWGALMLQKKGYDVSSYVPYLLGSSEDNKKFFPSAFLYLISGRDDQYGEMIGLMKQGKFWEITASPYNKYYDSALALMALSGTNAGETESAKSYFLTQQTQEGCWNSNNIRDTAILLASGWTREAGKAGGVGETNASGGTKVCENSGKYCEENFACLDGGGTIDYSYDCTSISQICCSIKVSEQACSSKGGKICSFDETCSVAEVPASDGSCCLESCNPRQTTAENACESAGGICKSNCVSGETESGESCAGGQVCCISTGTGAAAGGGISWLWIVLLIVLIALVVLAIIYRDKLKVYWAKYRTGGRGETRPVTRPGTPPYPMPPGAQGRMVRPGGPVYAGRPFMAPRGIPPRAPARPAASSRDKEMEETMRKLREMSK